MWRHFAQSSCLLSQPRPRHRGDFSLTAIAGGNQRIAKDYQQLEFLVEIMRNVLPHIDQLLYERLCKCETLLAKVGCDLGICRRPHSARERPRTLPGSRLCQLEVQEICQFIYSWADFLHVPRQKWSPSYDLIPLLSENSSNLSQWGWAGKSDSQVAIWFHRLFPLQLLQQVGRLQWHWGWIMMMIMIMIMIDDHDNQPQQNYQHRKVLKEDKLSK